MSDSEEEEEEYEMVFEPDEALILALNEISDLKQLVEEQSSDIEELKKSFLKLIKQKKQK
tara:strand:- start:1733 stop:1912 length:180 start_codon:yes stop_codon:yes gene_type:complete